VAQRCAGSCGSGHARFGPHLPQRGRHDRQDAGLRVASGMEKYLEEISVLSMPEDLSRLLAISERYGIFFLQ
jgi:hypothetical protein